VAEICWTEEAYKNLDQAIAFSEAIFFAGSGELRRRI